MFLLQPPPPTRYDVRFTLLGVPVRVHPLFWILAVFFGGFTPDPVRLVIWVASVFVSILIHELGHALAMRRYGQPSRIVLHLAGGLTVPEPVWWGGGWASVSLRPGQEVLVSLAGPGAGFLLAGLVMVGAVVAGGSIVATRLAGAIPFPTAFLPAGGRVANLLVTTLVWVNVFWGLMSLMPVYPLDGGNIARRLLMGVDPRDGMRKSLWLSVVAGAVGAAAGLLLLGSLYITFLFGLLAFQSYLSVQGHTGSWY